MRLMRCGVGRGLVAGSMIVAVTTSALVQAQGAGGEKAVREGSGETASVQAEEEEIVITGSRIKRSSFDTPTPVQVLNRDAITKTGASNMGDLIRVLTANSGSETQAGLGQGSYGGAQFNLRNLGVANTLVLVNGRRMVAYPDNFGVAHGSVFTDVNQIPLAFVERIEIAKGGASAIYGSDAIAGVVNIILRKNFEGVAVSASGFTTDDLDQQEGEVSVIAGVRSDESSIVAQFSYFKRTPLAAQDRGFTKGTMVSGSGKPGRFLLLDADMKSIGLVADPACGAEGTDTVPADGGCLFNYRRFWNMINQEERLLGYVNAEHRVSEAFQVFGELGYAHKQYRATQSPSYPSTAGFPFIPATHPSWPYSTAYPGAIGGVFLGRPFGSYEVEAYSQLVELNGMRAVGGLKGDLDKVGLAGWSWEATATWHMNLVHRGAVDSVLPKYEDAIGACADPTRPELCFTPFYPTEEHPLQNNQQTIDYVNGVMISRLATTLVVGEASLGGPILRLPGGDLAVALGVQARRNKAVSLFSNEANDYEYGYLYGLADWQGRQSVVAGYAELAIPAMPGVELQGAVRAEHYVNRDSTVNPRVAASWALDKTLILPESLGLRLRGSFGTAFRAPNLAQTHQDGTEFVLVDNNGDAPGGQAFLPASVAPNKALKPETSTAFSIGGEVGVETSSAGSVQLDGDFWQYDIRNLIIREDALRIYNACRDDAASEFCERLSGPVAASDTVIDVTYKNQSNLTARGVDFDFRYNVDLGGVGQFTLGTAGSYIISYLVPREDVVDIAVDSDSDGSVEYHTPPDCNEKQCDAAGKRNLNTSGPRSMPRLRARTSVGWQLGGHLLNLAANYISGYQNDGKYKGTTYDDIPPWMTFDLSYRYRLSETVLGRSTQVSVGVTNLLDTDPPYLGTGTVFGYDIFAHDPRGRVMHANLTHKF